MLHGGAMRRARVCYVVAGWHTPSGCVFALSAPRPSQWPRSVANIGGHQKYALDGVSSRHGDPGLPHSKMFSLKKNVVKILHFVRLGGEASKILGIKRHAGR